MEGPTVEPAETDAVPLEMEMEIEFSVPEIGRAVESWSVSGALPDGVTLSQYGVLSGVPHEPGTFLFDLTALAPSGEPIVGSFELVVEKQRFLVANLWASTDSSTSGVTVYDLGDRKR